MRLADRSAQPIRRLRHRDEMNVVGHEAVRPDIDSKSLARVRQQRDVQEVVLRTKECGLFAVATLRDVVGQTRDDGAGQSGHAFHRTGAL